ncbi:MAG: DNA primase [Gammaproteobacteria bacterium]|nr:DNA primase [Gammaproteobacteria bacterium]
MSGRIPQQFIDDLVSRVDIVEVIDLRVPLKKAGREYQACCPFHSEKTPSFTVSPDKQFYHCFGCGAHGTAIGFLMEYDRMEFVEAVEELAKLMGLEVPREGAGPAPVRREQDDSKPLYALLDRAEKFFRQQLKQHPDAPRAVEYLKGRGLSGEIARDFGVGFAPPGWDNLFNALGRENEKNLIRAGLVVEKEGGKRYDRFRDRIMFPIRDRRGRVIAFGGRVLGDDKPKYLNSPETPVFHKGRELYGLYEARQALRQLPRLLVVEGYMDVVALAQFDVRYAVATLGTSVTQEHLEQLFRHSDEVVFCFDGDRAGRDAAWRGLENALPLMRDGRTLRFMFMPEGEDPDTLIRQVGREGFEQAIERALTLDEFLVEHFKQQADFSRIDGQARLVELSKPLLARLPSGIYRHKVVERLAPLANMQPELLQQMLGGSTPFTPAQPRRAAKQTRRTADATRQPPSQVRNAITLLLQHPQLAAQVEDTTALAGLQQPGVGLLLEMLELLRQRPNLNTSALLEHWRGRDEERHLFTLAQRELLLDAEQDDVEKEFLGALRGLRQQLLKQRYLELSRKPLSQMSAEEKMEYQSLMQEMRG